jgi:hypothetical protein
MLRLPGMKLTCLAKYLTFERSNVLDVCWGREGTVLNSIKQVMFKSGLDISSCLATQQGKRTRQTLSQLDSENGMQALLSAPKVLKPRGELLIVVVDGAFLKHHLNHGLPS